LTVKLNKQKKSREHRHRCHVLAQNLNQETSKYNQNLNVPKEITTQEHEDSIDITKTQLVVMKKTYI
jgi:hypothetical protein